MGIKVIGTRCDSLKNNIWSR